jgi:hypothetical protein
LFDVRSDPRVGSMASALAHPLSSVERFDDWERRKFFVFRTG